MSFIGSRRALLSGSALKSSFAWDFAARQAIPPGATFTRASAAWSFNAAGVLVSAANNVLRIDHDPLTGAPLGYLAEMLSTNSVAYSSGLTSSGWANNDTGGATVTANAQTSPDGTVNAATVQETTTSLTHGQSFSSVACVSGSSYGVSAFIKNIVGSRWFQMNVGGGSGINFNPTTGAIGSTSSGITNAQARQLPNGWWRVSAQFVFGFTGNPSVRLLLVPAGTSSASQSYTGDGASTLAIWGVQFETAGVGVTSLIPTSGATATRAGDVLSLPVTSLTGWSASQGGVMVAAYRLYTIQPPASNFQQMALSLNDGSPTSNAVNLSANYVPGGIADGYSYAAGSPILNLHNATVAPVFTRRKYAFGWSTSRAQIAYNGILDATAGGGTLPTGMTTLDIGRSGSQALMGALESIAYYAGARSDAFVQQVSR